MLFSLQVTSTCVQTFNISTPGTFAVQVVPGSDHVRVVWLHPQDPEGGVAQRRAEDRRLVLDVSAGKHDKRLKLPHSLFPNSQNLKFLIPKCLGKPRIC